MKYNSFRNLIGRPYFTYSDIALKGIRTFKSQLSLWCKRGDILRVKRGLYVFAERMKDVSAEEIAFLLYGPSYISTEYALHHYGLIPEMVYSYTCVTTKTTREFYNAFGHYMYQNVKPGLFFGYETIQTPNGKYLLAEPEKAVLDYLYLNKKMKNMEDIEEMRINCEAFAARIETQKFNKYLEIFNNKRLSYLADILLKLCSRSIK